MKQFITSFNKEDSNDGIKELWDRIGNCLSEKSVETTDLYVVICIGVAMYTVLFCYLFYNFRTQIQVQTKVVVILILIIKYFVLIFLAVSIFQLEPAHTVDSDFTGFMKLKIIDLNIIQLAFITNLALTTYFNTKLYLT